MVWLQVNCHLSQKIIIVFILSYNIIINHKVIFDYLFKSSYMPV